MKSKKRSFKKIFDQFSTKLTKTTGSPAAFLIALCTVIVWLVSGPLFGFSDTWQLVINTGTTIITFLMVFVIQQSQNKDTMALHLKLNEFIASHEGASNRLINSEDLTEDELMVLKKFTLNLATLLKRKWVFTLLTRLMKLLQNHQEKLQMHKSGKRKHKATAK